MQSAAGRWEWPSTASPTAPARRAAAASSPRNQRSRRERRRFRRALSAGTNASISRRDRLCSAAEVDRDPSGQDEDGAAGELDQVLGGGADRDAPVDRARPGADDDEVDGAVGVLEDRG